MTNIMRFSLFALVLLFAACSSDEQPVTKIDNNIPAKEKELRDAIAQFPDSMLLKETLVQYFLDNGNYDVALGELDKLLEKDTADARLWDKKAELYVRKDETVKAISAYEKAIEIFPEPRYIMSLGWLYAETKNPKALELGEALIIADKANAAKEGILIKGLYYSNTGDKQKALTAFDNCLAIDYTFMLAYQEKAIVLYDTGKYEEAVKVLERATTLQNNFDNGYFWMGKCYEKLQKNNAAVESYQKAIFYNPDNLDAKDALAKLGIK